MAQGNFFDKFIQFTKAIKIDSKEEGVISFELNGSQRRFIQKVAEGFEKGVRYFTVLKPRQVGMSTVCLALDLYWMFSHEGMHGSVVTDTDTNRDYFRANLVTMTECLPRLMRVPQLIHNRNQMVLKNHSRLVYLTAGTRKSGSLGKGKGLNFLHATEVSSWSDEEGVISLIATLAETHPDRLYMWESTAQGFNLFYDMWEEAKKATTQMAIFIGWWSHERYSVPKFDPRYQTYWDGVLTPKERNWVREVKQLYDYEITPEQMAWWRWKLEEMVGDENYMMQNYPPTEEYAFILSGARFFSVDRLTSASRKSKDLPCDYYRYSYGHHFFDTAVHETNQHMADLRVWEYPDPEGVYVIGADPAYGSSPRADAFCIQVCRCYADKIEQVAEFRCVQMNTDQFAWVICHLAGSYKGKYGQCYVNIEIDGPGHAVQTEMDSLRRSTSAVPGAFLNEEPKFRNVVPSMVYYLFHRPDSLKGSYNLQWSSSGQWKHWMMNDFKSAFELGYVTINSWDCLHEMRNITQDGVSIGAEGTMKDDRAIAMALACIHWRNWILPELKARRMTYEEAHKDKQNQKKEANMVNEMVLNYLKRAKINLPEVDRGPKTGDGGQIN